MRRTMSTEPLRQYTIYNSPADYPDLYVVRRWDIVPGEARATDDVTTHFTLEDARLSVPRGLFCMTRSPGDDPCIVEVWM